MRHSRRANGSDVVLLEGAGTSLVQACRAMDIRPHQYLQDIFDRLLDHPARRLEELLPDRWKAARQALQAKTA